MAESNYLKHLKWLDDIGVLNESIKSKLGTKTLTDNEFVVELRDGVILCNLMNKLVPGCIDSNKIEKNIDSGYISVHNINLFIDACKKEFNFTDEDLFQQNMLFSLNIESILNKLSEIQEKTKSHEEMNNVAGDLNSKRDHVLHNNADNVLNSVTKETNLNFTKKDYVTKEIFNNEKFYVKFLTDVVNIVLRPLSQILSESDIKVIFRNIEKLKLLHERFLEELTLAIKGGHGRTSRICNVFEKFKIPMMKDYVDYFEPTIEISTSKIDSLSVDNKDFKNKLEDCKKNSEYKFASFSDLLRVPYSHVFKYKILFDELNKNVDEQHSAKTDVEQTCSSLIDFTDYLNEAYKDQENLRIIEKLNNEIKELDVVSQYLGRFIKDDSVHVKELGQLFTKSRKILLFDKAVVICKSRLGTCSYKSTLSFLYYAIEDSDAFDSENNTQLDLCNMLNSSLLKKISIFFKTKQQKNEWKNAINNAIDIYTPKDYNFNDHSFMYYNFDTEIVFCAACKKILAGIFYQGYKCSKCDSCVHRKCITKIESCYFFQKLKYVQFVSQKLNSADQANSDFIEKPQQSTLSTRELSNTTSKKNNEVSAQSIEFYDWYTNCDREVAETILNRIENRDENGIFLVRPRQQNGYAIALKYNSKVHHIQINTCEASSSDKKETVFYLTSAIVFNSVSDLVNYYTKNKLESTFKNLKTTLGVPFRKLIPEPLSETIAIFDYDPKSQINKNTGVEMLLKKDEKYWVLSKHSQGWWKVYNTVGLIGYAPGDFLIEIKAIKYLHGISEIESSILSEPIIEVIAQEDFNSLTNKIGSELKLKRYDACNILKDYHNGWLSVSQRQSDEQNETFGIVPETFLKPIVTEAVGVINRVINNFEIRQCQRYFVLDKTNEKLWTVCDGLVVIEEVPEYLFVEVKYEAIALDFYSICLEHNNEEIKLIKYKKYWILDKDENAELWNVCDSIGNVFGVPISYLEIIKSEAIALEDYSPIYDRDIELVKGALYYVLDKTDDNWKLCSTKDNIIGYAPAYLLNEIISRSITTNDFDLKMESSLIPLKLKKDQKYWLISKDKKWIGWWNVFDSDGHIGDAPASCFKEIIGENSDKDLSEVTHL